MKRLYCSKCDAPLRKKVICYSCGYNNEHLARKMKCRRILKVIIIIILVVGSIMLCNGLLLFPWQFEAQKDKHAAIEYVKTKYPEAKFKKGYYKTTEFRPGASKPYNQFIFEDSGMRFGVFVSEGRIAGDFYWEAYAEHQFYNTYIKPFVESRDITAEFEYIEFDLAEFYENNPNADISQYDGGMDFKVFLSDDERSKNPESLGWLYDFYCYSKQTFPFSYYVTIYCKGSKIIFTDESDFKSEADFYNSFY